MKGKKGKQDAIKTNIFKLSMFLRLVRDGVEISKLKFFNFCKISDLN